MVSSLGFPISSDKQQIIKNTINDEVDKADILFNKIIENFLYLKKFPDEK